MTALPRNSYRDPLDAMLRAEEKTCRGCRFRIVSKELSPRDLMPEVGCTHPTHLALLADKRCEKYEAEESV